MNLKHLVGAFIYICVYPIFRFLIRNTNRAYVLIVRDDQVLVCQNFLGFHNDWSLPGGGIHKNEEAKQAVIRETYEEVGITLESTKLKSLSNQKYRSKFGNNYTLFLYKLSNKPKILISKEIYRAKYIDFNTLRGLRLSDSTLRAIELVKWK